MAEGNKLFNYGSSSAPGWSSKTKAFSADEVEDKIEDRYISRENPRVSIPSPFARIQLMRDAFKICSNGFEKAEKRDRLLVSHTFDILELIYENPVRQGITLEVINLPKLFEHLKNVGQSVRKQGIGLLGGALESYANNETNGILDIGNIYILRKGENALAMTCPTSLVLPSPNYKYWQAQITINGDKPIFSEVKELYQRDFTFVKYLYTWFNALKSRNNGKTPDPLIEFGTYLEHQKTKISQINFDLYQAIEEVSKPEVAETNLEKNYVPVDFNGTEIQIFGLAFCKQAGGAVNNFIESASDLVLQSKINPKAKPLVLSVATQMSNAIYTSENVKWDSNKPGFTYDDLNLKNQPIESRELPNGTPYSHGFIYDHDFLADCIFKLPYKLNTDEKGFFDGNIEGCPDDCGFIPPIKMKYFEYFTIDDLKKNIKILVNTTKDRFNSDLNTVNQVQVVLKVPVKGGFVTFRKTYMSMDQENIELNHIESSPIAATGNILESSIALSIFPFVRFKRKEQNHYTVQLMRDQFSLSDYNINLKFYKKEESGNEYEDIDVKKYRRRSESKIDTIVNYSIQDTTFSLIEISINAKEDEDNNVLTAILIPDFNSYYEGNNHKFLQFSFDFGTSNTYVAVKENDDEFIDFKLPVDLLVSTISNSTTNLSTDLTVQSFELYSKQEMFPKWVKQLPFPLASVIATPKKQDAKVSVDDTEIPLFASYIPFLYGYEDYGRNFNEVITGLKWGLSNQKVSSQMTFAFINEIMLLAQAFAVTKDVNLSKCSIIWTYPLSMSATHIRSFQKHWEEAYEKYFANDEEGEEVKKISESIAPMLYHLDQGMAKRDTALSIDIGGGTCDIVVVPDGKIKKSKLSSIGFGADVIFGIDERARNIKMIENAIKEIKSRLQAAEAKGDKKVKYLKLANDLQDLLDENKKAAEATGTLFNLQRNEIVKDIVNQVSYNRWLQEKPFYHNIFQYYYAAILYFLTKLCENEGCTEDMRPTRFYFSGSGSKMLDIIDSKAVPLESLTTALYNHFAEDDFDEDDFDITIKKAGDMSKEITAKGALPSNKAIEFRNELAESKNSSDVEKNYCSRFKLLDSYENKDDIAIADLEDSELIEAVTKTVVDFHNSFAKFVELEGEEFNIDAEKMDDDFLSLKEQKIKKYVRTALGDIYDESSEKEKEKGKYADVPFFAAIKNIIRDVVAPD
ncbi:MAG: hypothetical protein J1E16_00100 [Muribaculaceae bacterium]|nr:hypothetical protein [Muribaculaceae bacterium]